MRFKEDDSHRDASLTRSSLSVFVSVKPVGPSNVLSMAQLRTLPLGEQVKTLMKNGRPSHLRPNIAHLDQSGARK